MRVTFNLVHRNSVKTAAAMGSRDLSLMEPAALRRWFDTEISLDVTQRIGPKP